ncbi:MAG: outer membrane beta-barrel protein [Pyrinomonadaceae bacterium]
MNRRCGSLGDNEWDIYESIDCLIQKNQGAWQSFCAVCGLAGGVLSPVIATLLIALTWFIDSQRAISVLNVLSIVSFVLTIPLLTLGAHCLDLLERKTACHSPLADSQRADFTPTASSRLAEQDKTARLILTGISTASVFLMILPAAAYAQQPNLKTSTTNLRDSFYDPSKEDASASRATSSINLRDSRETSVTPETSPIRSAAVAQAPGEDKSTLPAEEPSADSSQSQWQYGGFIDLGYLLDFNHPSNRLFRSRGTTFRIDRLHLNMAGVYAKKKAAEQSRWGIELTAHAGKDSEVFGFSATAPNIGGYKFLRQLGPTNVSYLAPVGKGLALQAGIFGSLIGYDSLYAKDNFNYTRPWGADFTPYYMMGVNASYPFSEKLTGTFFVINGYWHLARANNVPSSGGQLAHKVNPRVTVKETVLLGPHQANTSFKFWRFLSDTIVERKTDRVTFAFEYTTSWERVDAPGSPRALMMSSQLPVRWTLNNRWAVAVRPEVFWDRDGRWTLARQTVKAITTTLEYRIPYRQTNSILRLEHRYDDSRGPDGGFFRGAEVRPGVVGLTPTQHLLIFGLIFTFDRQ